MGFESLLHRITDQEDPLKKEVERYKKEKRIGKLLGDRTNRLARIAVVGLTLQGGALGEEPEHTKVPTPEQPFASELLDRQISTGTIRLSNGDVLTIPKPGEHFKNVIVYLPKERSADRLLVVFGQIHDLPKEVLDALKADTKNKFLRGLMESQRAIYDGLKDMVDGGTISKVCSESLSDTNNMLEMESYYRDFLPGITANIVAKYLPESNIGRVIKRKDELFADNHLSPEEYNELQSDIDPVIQQHQDQYRYAVSAAGLLAAEGKVKLCPAANEKTYNVAWGRQVQEIQAKPRTKWTLTEQEYIQKTIFEDREDAAISLAVAQGDRVIAIEYGALHDFTDAVGRWNQDNPSIQVGLVEVGAKPPSVQ